jgi:2-C-methyl-D-erythritol 4-phosphate cytidylyltransferase
MGGIVAKQYLPLAGMPVIVHTVLNALRTPGVTSVVIALAPDDTTCRHLLAVSAVVDDRLHFVEGGEERQESVQKALAHGSLTDVDVILVHDAVRPLATPALFEAVSHEAARLGAVVPVVPVVDTIKEVRDGRVVRTVPRDDLRRAQTPQGFRASVLRDAYAKAGSSVLSYTDDASVVEGAGYDVFVCAGEPWNLKLTKPDDFRVAEQHLESVSDSDGT